MRCCPCLLCGGATCLRESLILSSNLKPHTTDSLCNYDELCQMYRLCRALHPQNLVTTTTMNALHDHPRPNRGVSRGRGGRGRGRGGRGAFQNRDQYGDRPTLHPVPSTREVVVGAPVSIVLKVDQPTGLEVQGIVAELLTNGNHPRGIKVRLQDGRVGRVQRMASMEAATTSSAGLTGLGRNGEVGPVTAEVNNGIQITQRASANPVPVQYTDFRYDGGEAPDRPELSLTDYIVTKPKGKKGKKKGQAIQVSERTEPSEPVEAATSTCPVCSNFEGDEAAVAHHVATHFE